MSQIGSKKARRQNRIIDALGVNPAMRVTELADTLDVSAETVRRDLAELDAEGRIKRTYGGAVRTTVFEPALSERLNLHIGARERIARAAVAELGAAESLFVGGGATTLHFARALKSIKRRVTVLTASFSVAMELSVNPLIEVLALPGVVEPKEGLVHGPETLACIARYRTPVAVIGASALDHDGVSEALLSAAQVYQSMIESADRALVLADASKFGNRALRLIHEWGPDSTLITDCVPDPVLRDAVEDAGGRVRVAPAPG